MLDLEEGLNLRLFLNDGVCFILICEFIRHADFCDAVFCSLEPARPAGALGCVTGWKGPGKQCSLAFLHDRSDANRGTVKGILPLELRGTQREMIFSLFLNLFKVKLWSF